MRPRAPRLRASTAELLAFAQQRAARLEKSAIAAPATGGSCTAAPITTSTRKACAPTFRIPKFRPAFSQRRHASFTFHSSRSRMLWSGTPQWTPTMCIDAAPGQQGKLLGRIYLDMHPREGKDKWFSSAPLSARHPRPSNARRHAGVQFLRRRRQAIRD